MLIIRHIAVNAIIFLIPISAFDQVLAEVCTRLCSQAVPSVGVFQKNEFDADMFAFRIRQSID